MNVHNRQFSEGYFYHIFNRGVEKRIIFLDESDYERFLKTMYYYQFKGPKPRFSTHKKYKSLEFEKNPKIVEIVCYCLMPNHFHFCLKQLEKNGITEYMSKISNSYTKYLNKKYGRVGPLFQGGFQSVFIQNEEQLMHTSRYIHLNPYVAGLVKNVKDWKYSSFNEYMIYPQKGLCNAEPVMCLFKDSQKYEEFVVSHQDYAKELKLLEDY